MIEDANGDLLGTAAIGGGTPADGTVFELAKSTTSTTGFASTPTALFTFTGKTGNTLGQTPDSSLTADAKGDLFGTTQFGGTGTDGTVFEIQNTATGLATTLTTLINFTGTAGANPGAQPDSGLTIDAKGDLFGTTTSGGTGTDGTVFEIQSNATTLTTLANFNGTGNGAFPESGLILDAVGDLFGTTAGGGANTDGTVFEIGQLAGGGYAPLSTVFTFSSTTGTSPIDFGGLAADASGNLFGTTLLGGTFTDGTVFELTGAGYVPVSAVDSPPALVTNTSLTISLGSTGTITASDLIPGALDLDS